MTYYAKDCIFMFFIGLIPAFMVKDGVVCWAIICYARYCYIKANWKKIEANAKRCKKKAEKKGWKKYINKL